MANQHTIPIPLEVRFWAKVDKQGPDDCWPWLACTNTKGYGILVGNPHRTIMAHRFAYELLKEPILDGLTLDHLCRNHLCVNPAHLEPVTIRINVLRGNGNTAQKARQIFCSQQHPFDLFNTGFDSRGRRYCKACKQIRQKLAKGNGTKPAPKGG